MKDKVMFNLPQKIVIGVMALVTAAMAYAYATGQFVEFTFNHSGLVR